MTEHPDELEELAHYLATGTAPWLVWGVYRRDPGLIAELLEPMDVQQLRALAVALTAAHPAAVPIERIFDSSGSS